MEILKKFGIIKKKNYYLYDNFDDTMTVDFRKLKGRYYKKTNHWVFPLEIENILFEKKECIDSVLKENNNGSNEKDESIETDKSIEIEESITTNVTVVTDKSIELEGPLDTDDSIKTDESFDTDDSVHIVNLKECIEYKYNPPQEFYKYILNYII